MTSTADHFTSDCRESAEDPDAWRARAVRGAQHLVLVGSDTVWRFPLYGPDCHRLNEMAARLGAVVELGLPAPDVLRVVPGPPGRGHLVLSRIHGTPLLTALSRGMDAERAVSQALLRLREARTGQWPFPQLEWSEMWLNFAATARRHRRDLPADELRHLLQAADRACVVACAAPHRLVHGDLASDNILVAEDGSLAGILDWDGAIVGDPAIDTAAALHALPDSAVPGVLAACPWLAVDLERWEAYRDTWELQNLLWKLGLTPPLWAGTGR